MANGTSTGAPTSVKRFKYGAEVFVSCQDSFYYGTTGVVIGEYCSGSNTGPIEYSYSLSIFDHGPTTESEQSYKQVILPGSKLSTPQENAGIAEFSGICSSPYCKHAMG